MSEDNNNAVETTAPATIPSDSDLVALLKAKEDARFDPADQAAAMFHVYFPRFCMLVDGLSNKALRRVLKNVIESPLNSEEFRFSSEREKEAYILGDRLMSAKQVMVQTIVMEEMEKEHIARQMAETDETKE